MQSSAMESVGGHFVAQEHASTLVWKLEANVDGIPFDPNTPPLTTNPLFFLHTSSINMII